MVHKSTSDRKRQQIRKLLTVSLLYLLCFFARAVGLMYRPITHTFMPNWVFWLVTYWLPELVPTVYQCYLIHFRLLKAWRQHRSSHSHTTNHQVQHSANTHSVQLTATARRSSATNSSTPHLDTEHNA